MEFFQVYNIIPSISSITGISPQRYFWRGVISLHLSPRLIIAYVHKNYLKHHVLSKIADRSQLLCATRLANVVHWLNLIEISALGGVTYISNKENYREFKSVVVETWRAILRRALIRMLTILSPSSKPTNPNPA